MRIGYSFWGFLGPGITDTPDGGRSHRRTLVDGLRGSGYELVFLQANRDLLEAGYDYTATYTWDSTGLPVLDALFLEWRWPIPGRNTTACGTPGHTCDLHRQQALLDHYTRRGVFTIIWDKDRQLPADDPLRHLHNIAVAEAALHPTLGAWSLLFPVGDHALDQADPAALAQHRRNLPLVYVGNQYDRDRAFDQFFAPAATRVLHQVSGKWTRTERWPHITFAGRIPYAEVDPLYVRSLATVLLLPDRYAATGQTTQRLFEAVLAGCLPLTPATIRSAERFTPSWLHVRTGNEVLDRLTQAWRSAGSEWHVQLIASCLRRLDQFRLSRQLRTIEHILAGARYRLAIR
jgi:hypothetical protein